MYRFFNVYKDFGEQVQTAHGLFNSFGAIMAIVASLFFIKSKAKSLSLFSHCAIAATSHYNVTLGKVVTYILAAIEGFFLAYIGNQTANLNGFMGELVGTGVNYFGGLFMYAVPWFFVSVIFISNPIKNIDILTMTLPFRLIFIKLACFFNGCCWGIPWEYGPYNYNFDHPGKQVPLQAIEAIIALLIFVFLVIYRKKAKPGTIFPMYLILYSFTRFFTEFLSGANPNIIGPFNTYHVLCAIGFVIGLISFILAAKFGKKLSEFFDSIPLMIQKKLEPFKKKKALAAEQVKAQEELAEQERLEKVKLARAKAKARRRK